MDSQFNFRALPANYHRKFSELLQAGSAHFCAVVFVLAKDYMNKTSKRIAAFVTFALLTLLPTCVWSESGYIQDTAGLVSISTGKDEPRQAVTNDTVTSDTLIKTGDDSYAVLKFEDGQIVNLEPNTTFKVRSYSYKPQLIDKSAIVFSMFKGGMRLVSGLIGKHNPKTFRLATPNVTVGILGTDFLISVKNGQTYVQVLSGSVKLTNAVGTLTFSAPQTALVTSATKVPSIIADASIPAGTFTGAIAINLEEALAAQASAAEDRKRAAALLSAESATAAEAAAVQTAGGAATGGAMTTTTTITSETGISATTIAIGIGVAAGVAAMVNTTSTTHH